MKKVWPSLLAAWFAALAAYGCGADQRSLGSLGAPQAEAGTAPDSFVDGLTDGPVDGLPGSQDTSAGETDAVAEVWVPFGSVSLFPPLASTPASQADPTLTADELELYFSSNPNTDWDIWVVKRASSSAQWLAPSQVAERRATPWMKHRRCQPTGSLSIWRVTVPEVLPASTSGFPTVRHVRLPGIRRCR